MEGGGGDFLNHQQFNYLSHNYDLEATVSHNFNF